MIAKDISVKASEKSSIIRNPEILLIINDNIVKPLELPL